jgi:hypothetical protein
MLDVKAQSADPTGQEPTLVPVRQTRRRWRSSRPEDRVALRQLIIATNEQDVGLPAWTAILDKIGTPYDVLFASAEPLHSGRLVRTDGVGRYNAVLLTSSTLFFKEDTGGYRSAFDPDEWRTLWEYERTFAVRQAAVNGSPRGNPEDYCLQLRDEGPTGTGQVTVCLTAAGARVFDHLAAGARLPLTCSYVYRSRLTTSPGCQAAPLLTIDSDVVGVVGRSPDGRERLALTFTLGAAQPIEDLLGFGLVRWATRGIFLGEKRHWINVDIDDWFNTYDRGSVCDGSTRYHLGPDETLAITQQQRGLRERFPLAAGFTLNLAYNGRGAASSAVTDRLADTLPCLRKTFRWINHTYSHEPMNWMSYERSRDEIKGNLDAASALGLPVPHHILKTPEYSGLGVFRHPDPGRPPYDLGLERSNAEMLRAAQDLGVRYLHGNMSFRSHRPGCHNGGFHHPLRPGLFVVPDWPTCIAWGATTPDQEVSSYAAIYGEDVARDGRAGGQGPGHGQGPDHDGQGPGHDGQGPGHDGQGPGHDGAPAYDDIIDAESELALRHLMAGSAYTHTLHQANLRQYLPGRSLAFDWLNALLVKYSAYYRVPLRNPDWSGLATYIEARTAHCLALRTGPDAVWDRDTNTVEYVPRTDTTLFVTGLAIRPATRSDRRCPDEAEVYGADTVSRLRLARRRAVTLLARPRP